MSTTVTEVRCTKRDSSVWTLCKCPPCLEGRYRLDKQRKAGLLTRFTPEEAWRVLEHLIDERGWDYRAIASATGVSRHSIRRALLRRREGHLLRFGIKACAGIVNHGDPTEGHISVVPLVRRTQGLARMGWRVQDLAEITGVPRGVFTHSVTGRRTVTDWANHKALADAYRDLAMRPGPSQRTATIARTKGWPSPADWEQDIDLLSSVPEPEAYIRPRDLAKRAISPM